MSHGKEHRQQPVYWFALLDIALEKGDLESAQKASQQLKRLGVEVKYRRPRLAEVAS